MSEDPYAGTAWSIYLRLLRMLDPNAAESEKNRAIKRLIRRRHDIHHQPPSAQNKRPSEQTVYGSHEINRGMFPLDRGELSVPGLKFYVVPNDKSILPQDVRGTPDISTSL